MRRSLLKLATVCALLAILAGGGTPASAATVKKLRKPPAVTVQSTLAKLLRRDRITATEYRGYLNQWVGDLREQKSLRGWREVQLTDVSSLLTELAVSDQMTAPRLPVIFLTLKQNAAYWRTGKQLVYADRIEFPGSELEWEFYPGYGLQLQVLGTFGEANGFYELPDKVGYPQLAQVLDEMEAVAVPRAGGIAWEYYFNWEGGAPPWVSAMAQATGIEALTNGYSATGNAAYLTEAHDALGLLETAPPTGVEVTTALGARFLQYSFAPNTDIINAFLQTLIGLYDYQEVSHDPTALALFNLGNAQAQSELPSFVVNGWSLYQPGQLDNLNYHQLVTGFLQSLCKKLNAPVYCNTYAAFQSDITTRPTLSATTLQAPANTRFKLRFALSKPAYVGITLSQGSKDYLYTKSEFNSGTQYFKAPKLKAGAYNLAMSATDLVGHYVKITGTLQVCKGGCAAPVTTSPPTTTGTTPTTTTTTPTSTTTSTTSTTTTATTPAATTCTTTGTGGSCL